MTAVQTIDGDPGVGGWRPHVVPAQATKAAGSQSPGGALALEQQGKNPEAEAAWRAYLKEHPTIRNHTLNWRLLEARQEHYKEAVPLYRKALAMNPHVPGLRLNLGLALFKFGDLKGCAPGVHRVSQGGWPADPRTPNGLRF